MGKRVAITGVNGVFASAVLPRLQADAGIEEIIGIDATPWRGGVEKLRFFRADVRCEPIVEILKGADVVYHFASTAGGVRGADRARHLDGPRNVFDACAVSSVKRIIHASSTTVYGTCRDTPNAFTEESPPSRNEDNTGEIELEDLASEFVRRHPEITVTVIRAAPVVGPGIEGPISRLWSSKVIALPSGGAIRHQLIHRDDLGAALHLAGARDLPGTFNVSADDAVAASWCSETAGGRVIRLPRLAMTLMAKVGRELGLTAAGGGRLRPGSHAVCAPSDKFKRATGWAPQYTSEQAFLSSLRARERDPDRRDDLYHLLLSWGSRQRSLLKLFLKGLDAVFQLARIPWVRSAHPWMAPEKTSVSYLPIDESLGPGPSQLLPQQVVLDFIEKASVHVVMDTCACRTGHRCDSFTNEIGCLFMGESALEVPAGASRRITREQALQHARRAISLGLVPMTGKLRVDNFLMMTPDRNRLLTVCFCCHCCCMMRYYRRLPAEQLDQIIPPVEGLSVRVTGDCVGCGTCVEYCAFDAISIEDGVAIHGGRCRGCGRCATHCPQGAVKISIDNPDAVADVEQRIESYLDEY